MDPAPWAHGPAPGPFIWRSLGPHGLFIWGSSHEVFLVAVVALAAEKGIGVDCISGESKRSQLMIQNNV